MSKPVQHAEDHRRAEVRVIGVGNLVRGDDGAGILAARLLRERRLRGVEVIEVQGDGTSLIDWWKAESTVIVIDAVSSQNPPGTIVRIDAFVKRLPEAWSLSSTHSVGLRGAIELARALGCLPERLIVYGIEGAQFTTGAGLSPQVEQAVLSLVETIVDDIMDIRRSTIACRTMDEVS
jgi:hydrogenase maturation protease